MSVKSVPQVCARQFFSKHGKAGLGVISILLMTATTPTAAPCPGTRHRCYIEQATKYLWIRRGISDDDTCHGVWIRPVTRQAETRTTHFQQAHLKLNVGNQTLNSYRMQRASRCVMHKDLSDGKAKTRCRAELDALHEADTTLPYPSIVSFPRNFPQPLRASAASRFCWEPIAGPSFFLLVPNALG